LDFHVERGRLAPGGVPENTKRGGDVRG
jgi:hypothetical protein